MSIVAACRRPRTAAARPEGFSLPAARRLPAERLFQQLSALELAA